MRSSESTAPTLVRGRVRVWVRVGVRAKVRVRVRVRVRIRVRVRVLGLEAARLVRRAPAQQPRQVQPVQPTRRGPLVERYAQRRLRLLHAADRCGVRGERRDQLARPRLVRGRVRVRVRARVRVRVRVRARAWARAWARVRVTAAFALSGRWW